MGFKKINQGVSFGLLLLSMPVMAYLSEPLPLPATAGMLLMHQQRSAPGKTFQPPFSGIKPLKHFSDDSEHQWSITADPLDVPEKGFYIKLPHFGNATEVRPVPDPDETDFVFHGSGDDFYINPENETHPSTTLVAIRGRCPVLVTSEEGGITQYPLCDGTQSFQDVITSLQSRALLSFSKNEQGEKIVIVRTENGGVITMTIKEYRYRMSLYFEYLLEWIFGELPVRNEASSNGAVRLIHRTLPREIVEKGKKDLLQTHGSVAEGQKETIAEPPVHPVGPEVTGNQHAEAFQGAGAQQEAPGASALSEPDMPTVHIQWTDPAKRRAVMDEVIKTYVAMLNSRPEGQIVLQMGNRTYKGCKQMIVNLENATPIRSYTKEHREKKSCVITVKPTENQPVSVRLNIAKAQETYVDFGKNNLELGFVSLLDKKRRQNELVTPFFSWPEDNSDSGEGRAKYVQCKRERTCLKRVRFEAKKHRPKKGTTLAKSLLSKKRAGRAKVAKQISGLGNSENGGVICFHPHALLNELPGYALTEDDRASVYQAVKTIMSSIPWVDGALNIREMVEGEHWKLEFIGENPEIMNVLLKVKPMPGVVFAEKPLSYKMENNQVKELTLQEWLDLYKAGYGNSPER